MLLIFVAHHQLATHLDYIAEIYMKNDTQLNSPHSRRRWINFQYHFSIKLYRTFHPGQDLRPITVCQ